MPTLARIIPVICMMSVLLAGAAAAEENSGTWRGRWWNYYDRALERSDTGDWEGARSDLQRALQLRDRDQRRARTYGMHFQDYFPHRELGVVWHHLGQPEKALHELEVSYRQEESAKGAYYLNIIRSGLLKSRRTVPKPPVILLEAPSGDTVTRDIVLPVRGRVTAEGLVAAVKIDGIPVQFDLARNEVSFMSTVPVDEDTGQITIEAVDLAGGTTRLEVPVRIDRAGPSFTLAAIGRIPGNSRKVHLRGMFTDNSGVRELVINGSRVTPPADGVEFDTVVTLDREAASVHMEATDRLGNQTVIELDPDQEQAALREGGKRVLAALNGPGGLFSSDREPPVVALKDSADLAAVYIDRYYVEGEVFDNDRVERVTVNGREVQILKGRKVFFSRMVRLKEGNNRIVVEAFDGSGNRKSSEFNVKRVVPAARQVSARMSVTVLPFSGRVKNPAVQEMADDFLFAALVEQKRFKVVEREKLKQLLQEQKLAREHLTDPDHSLRVGRLISADTLLATTIAEGTRSVEIVSRLINSETGEVMETKDAYVEDKSLSAVRDLMDGLAARFAHSFPVLEGTVVKRDRQSIFTDLGSTTGVRTSMGAAVFRRGKEIKHPVTGKSLGWDMVSVSTGIFEDVQEGFSKVRLYDGGKSSLEAQVKDIVVTR